MTTSVELGAAPAANGPADVGAMPRRVAVSVVVPSGYYEQIWRQGHPARRGSAALPNAATLAEIQTIENHRLEQRIAPLLPKASGGEAQIAVTAFHPLVELPPVESPLRATLLAWFGQYAHMLGLAALGIVALVMLRSIVKALSATNSTTVAAPPAVVPPEADAFATEHPLAPAATGAARERLRHRADGPSLRDELAEVVREDPRAAVSILRTWIGHSG